MRTVDYFKDGIISQVDNKDNKSIYGHYYYGNTGYYIDNVVVSEGITNIPEDTFVGQTLMTNITLPNSLTNSDNISFPNGLFSGCTSLSKVNLPDTLVSIPDDVFYGCTSLKEIKLPSSLIYLGRSFRRSGITNITIPNNVNSNSEIAGFADCNSLTTVTLGEGSSLPSIGLNAFLNCTKLSDFIAPTPVQQVNHGAFSNCGLLSTFNFDNTVQVLAEAFRGTSIKNVKFSDKLVGLGISIFRDNLSLETVEFGTSNVPEIYSGIYTAEGIDKYGLRFSIANCIGKNTPNLKSVIVPKGSIEQYTSYIKYLIDNNVSNSYDLDECKRILPLIVEKD